LVAKARVFSPLPEGAAAKRRHPVEERERSMAGLKLADTSNRKPADELADIRERIKILKERESILRDRMLAGECSLAGDEFDVVISKVKSERIDTATLKRELGLKFLRPFLSTVETSFVKIKRRA
jgi:hypothetical protein